MDIKNVSTPARIVDTYTFLSPIGFKVLEVDVCEAEGDTIKFTDEKVKILITPKPSPFDPNSTLPAREITILLAHIVGIEHTCAIQEPATVEENLAFKQLIDEYYNPKAQPLQ